MARFRFLPPLTSICSMLLVVGLASAQSDPKKAEAAQRFDRGLTLFEDGDNAGALAEFKQTYQLFPNPVVLYNIGLVYAAMGRPVEAVDALEKAVAAEGLPAEQRERARATLTEQAARIGRLTVTTVPEGARVELNNVEVARTPLTGPIKVATGSHVVGAVAEGYAPMRKEITVAGNADASAHFELVSTQGKLLSNLSVKAGLKGVDVLVDGQLVGKTPLSTSITLVAGKHAVELRRPGYTSIKKDVELGPGATGELSFDLTVDEARLAAEGATLSLDLTEDGAVVFVNGEHKGPYRAPLRLPPGVHRIRIERGGFFPVERDVDLSQTSVNQVRVELEPTPEMRSDYESSASFHRTWGWIGVIGGAVIAGGGGAWLAMNAGPKDDARAELEALLDARDAEEDFPGEPGPDCNVREAGSDPERCNKLVDEYDAAYQDAKAKDIPGFIGLGVGGAVLVTGVILLVTGDDPDRYERKATTLGRAPSRPRVGWAPGPGDVGGGLQLAF